MQKQIPDMMQADSQIKEGRSLAPTLPSNRFMNKCTWQLNYRVLGPVKRLLVFKKKVKLRKQKLMSFFILGDKSL